MYYRPLQKCRFVSICHRVKETLLSALNCEKCMVGKLSEHIKSMLVTSIELWSKFGAKTARHNKGTEKNDKLTIVFTSS